MGPFGDRDKYRKSALVRDFQCEFYELCLDSACKRGWKWWTCEGCELVREGLEVKYEA